MPKAFNLSDGDIVRAIREGYLEIDAETGQCWQNKTRNGERCHTYLNTKEAGAGRVTLTLLVPKSWNRRGDRLYTTAARAVWIAVHGPIADHLSYVAVKDGNIENIGIDNLRLVSMANKPADVQRAMYAKANETRARNREAQLAIKATAKDVEVKVSKPKIEVVDMESRTIYHGVRLLPNTNGGVLVSRGSCPTCGGEAGAFATVKWGSTEAALEYRALGATEANRVLLECVTAIAGKTPMNATVRELTDMARQCIAATREG